MTFKRKSGGAWTNIINVKRRSGSSWVAGSFVKVREAGAWVKVWPGSATVNLVNHTLAAYREPNDFPPPQYTGGNAFVFFNTNGILSWTGTSGTIAATMTPAVGATEWLVSGNAADCQIYATVTAGTATTGTFDTWLDMTSNLSFGLSTTGNLTGSCTIQFTVRDKVTQAQLDQCSIDFSVS